MKKMKKMKKTVAVLLVLAFSLTAAACKAPPRQAKTAGDTYKIGIILYQWTDDQGTNIKRFCDYLQAGMNVEFVYEATYYNDDAQVSCVENLIGAGCDAIISGYGTNLIAVMDTVKAAGVYYTIALDYASVEDFAGVAPSEYFLGGTQQFAGDKVWLGEAYAQAALNSGFTQIGGVSFPAWAFTEAVEIYAAFQAKLVTEGLTVADIRFASGFMVDEVQAAAQRVINENPAIEVIFGMSSGLDYVYPILRNTAIKLISMGYDDSVQSLMENGALVAAGNNNQTQSIASCVARIINAIEGNRYPDTAEGAYNQGVIVNGVANYLVLGNLDQLADYKAYVIGDASHGSVTIEELERCIISKNPNATLAGLNTLTNRTLDEIKAAR